MKLHHYHCGENGSAISGAWSIYVGKRARTWFKGWYSVLPGRKPHNYVEVEFALGGEDNMLQAGLRLPLLGCAYVGVRVPRALTRGWIYERREWALRVGYIGYWLELLIGYDDSASDMASYYRAKRKRGEGVAWTRFATWPGVRLKVDPRLRDWLLGRRECVTTVGEPFPVVVPMPEGNYPAKVKREERVWRRKRWPFSAERRVDYSIDMDVPVPVPGKGENSWDCDDDAIWGTGGSSVPEAVANVTRAALRDRERYASSEWTPGAGWPEGIAR